MSVSLSEAQVERYRQEGFLAPLPGLSGAEATALRHAVEDFGRRHQLYEALVLRNKAHLKMPSLLPVIRDARILDAVEGILGPDILCWGSSLFIKEPGAPDYVAWHQDSYYWDMTPEDVCVVWIALIESTRENGAMRVIPGSHRWKSTPHKPSPEGSGNMLFTYEEIAVDIDENQAVDCLLRPGEMSIHHMSAVHGSPPNRSADRRMGYSITYVAPHVRHGGKRNSAMLVRGEDRYGYFAADPLPEREMQPEICAFVDAPFGGGIPVRFRKERPPQDFYRATAAH
jgi:hypothetical protein